MKRLRIPGRRRKRKKPPTNRIAIVSGQRSFGSSCIAPYARALAAAATVNDERRRSHMPLDYGRKESRFEARMATDPATKIRRREERERTRTNLVQCAKAGAV